MQKKILLVIIPLLAGLGSDDIEIDTSWVDDVAKYFFDAISDATIGENGVFMIVFNLLPVVGNNSMAVEVWFMLAIFGGFLILMWRMNH